MPSLGADMDEGTLLEWLVQPGQTVRKGETVAVVDTAKAAIDVECFEDGVVEELLVEPGTRVPVGTPLAMIGAAIPAPAGVPGPTAAAPPSAPAPPSGAPEPVLVEPVLVPSVAEPPVAQPVPTFPQVPPVAAPHTVSSPLVRRLAVERGVDLTRVHGTGPDGHISRADVEHARPPRSSPLARRLAAELGVDLARVAGTGAHGVVRAEDVRLAAAQRAAAPAPAAPPAALPSAPPAAPPAAVTPPAAPPPAVPAPRTGHAAEMRAAIARLMARSKREVPHYYLSTTVDLGAATTWMREQNRERDVSDRLVVAALLLKASALAVRQVPAVNGFWVDDGFVPGSGVHLGVAVSLRGGGLLAPAIHDADTLEVGELMRRLRDLVGRARTGSLRRDEMADPTITVTNLGEQGVEAVQGVIYPPQVALVGFGKVVERPWAVDGLLGVRPLVTATLAADHRATDGFTGGRYLDAVDRLLQRPQDL